MRFQVSLAIVLGTLALAGEALHETISNKFYRTYECSKDNHCRRTARPIDTIDPSTSKNEHTSLASCRLVCDDAAGLWPIPTGYTIFRKYYMRIDPLHINFDTKSVPASMRSYMAEVSDIFVSNLRSTCGARCESFNSTMTIEMRVRLDNVELDWSTDESYELIVTAEENETSVQISAPTIYGARHALETLSQLTAQVIIPNGGRGLVILARAKINDSPMFRHRGLLIDTARNFLTIAHILKTIDALGSTKMNVLHWHATDSQSFPLQIKSRPSMALYGAYSSEKIYSLEDLAHVVLYAKYRGVRVILELDSPSHVGAGWEWGPSENLGDIAVCVNRQPWRKYCIQPPCGQINPVNPNTYEVLRDIYRDVLGVMGTRSVLHLGGDEVYINCWNTTPEITTVMENKGMGLSIDDFLQLWGNFHNEQARVLDAVRAGTTSTILWSSSALTAPDVITPTILWSSALTAPDVITRYLDKNRFVIQTWIEADSPIPEQLLKLGYRLIISTKNTWYLDHGFWGRTQYHTWRDAYSNRIPRVDGVLGGEACMWGEYVDGGSLDVKVWPRAAAVAERLWSDPLELGTIDAEPRLQAHRARLESRGVSTDAMAPEWCNQHEKMCM